MVETLDISDVAHIVRILAGIPAVPDVAVRRRHVLVGLAHLIDAQVWAWGLSRIDPDRQEQVYFAMAVEGGWRSEEQRRIATHPNVEPAVTDGIQQRLLQGTDRHVTHTRRQLVGDAEWYLSRFYLEYRHAAGLDDFMFSHYPLGDPAGTLSTLGFHRGLGVAPFGARELCLVHLVASQIDWLHREGSDVPAADHVVSLSPRLRQVMLLLLTGLSRKQIARELGLSEHTLTDYMKDLHRRFNVNSRGELLSRFISGGGAPLSAVK